MARFPAPAGLFATLLVLSLFFAVLLQSRSASADDARAEAEATYERAAQDDEAMHFADALAGYERSIAILPSHRWAQRADTRIAFLRSHAEGDFVPLATLEAVRRTPGATKDPARIDALAAAARGFPHGAVRGEAFFVCGEAWLTELGRPDDAEGAFAETIAEPAVTPVLRNQAAARLVDRALARGDVARAREVAASVPDPTLAKRVAVAARRGRLHVGALAILGAFTGFALVAVVRGRKHVRAVRRFAPWAVALVLWLGGVGGFLAARYERGNALPFVAFGALLLPIVLLARAWGVAASTEGVDRDPLAGPSARAPMRARRAGRALVSACAVLAAAFLLLERIDPRYLDGFGL